MRTTLIGISALLLGAGAINLGMGLQGSLIGLRAGIENFSTILTGVVMSSYYAGFVIGSLVAPRIVNRVGHIRTFSVFASLSSAATICHAALIDPISWIILRALTGLCFASLCLVLESWLNDRSSNLNRGALLSVYFVTILAATALGQILLIAAPASGYDLFVLVSVIVSLALVPVALTSTPMPHEIAPNRMALKRLFATSPVGIVGCFGAGLSTGAFWGLGAVYAQGIGLPITQIALFMTFMIAGGMAAQWPLGRLSDKIDRRLIIAAMSLGMAIVGTVIATGAVHDAPWLFVLGACAGALLLPLYSISIAHANDFMEARDFVPASASLLLIYGCGAAAGPIVATLFMSRFGPEGLFIHAAVTTSVVGLFAVYRMTQRPPVPEEDSSKFAVLPRTTAMAFELDPRSDENAAGLK
ncbi:MAG: MFS transporter [Hyphomicrobiales bacterium]|nr:MFS transporter [Hyphomicrobiales bacterium]